MLLAIIDQAEPEAMRALADAGIDPSAARRTALKAIGQPLDLPVVGVPPLCPAGYEGRPILDEDQLDAQAWEVLTRRQNHLPLHAIRTGKDWDRLYRLEADTARRVYKHKRLDGDQELSLMLHHLRRVQGLAHGAHPDLVPARRPDIPGDPYVPARSMSAGEIPDRRLPFFLDFLYNWGRWFGGRWSGITNRWERIQARRFALRTHTACKDS
jgi:hypothetical protein